MSISPKTPNPNLGPRPAAPRIADSFQSVGGTQTKLTHRIDSDWHKRFKIAVTQEGRTMGDVLEELIIAWTREHER